MSEILQGSPEWFAARLGKVTASRVADVVAKTKTGWGASRANYAAQLMAERLTGQVHDSFRSQPMEWGSETEADARAAYEFYADADVIAAGFVAHPTVPMSGASPDGFVGDDGLVEIKCPNTATHIDTLIGQTVPGKYQTQMQWQMACTGRAWCDYVSYDPRLPAAMRLFVRRVERNEETVASLEKEVASFLSEVGEKLAKLDGLYGPERAEAA